MPRRCDPRHASRVAIDAGIAFVSSSFERASAARRRMSVKRSSANVKPRGTRRLATYHEPGQQAVARSSWLTRGSSTTTLITTATNAANQPTARRGPRARSASTVRGTRRRRRHWPRRRPQQHLDGGGKQQDHEDEHLGVALEGTGPCQDQQVRDPDGRHGDGDHPAQGMALGQIERERHHEGDAWASMVTRFLRRAGRRRPGDRRRPAVRWCASSPTWDDGARRVNRARRVQAARLPRRTSPMRPAVPWKGVVGGVDAVRIGRDRLPAGPRRSTILP